ncbi:MAG: hypothetical protein JRC77_05450 [Deltaproteobacteria bacterium]|nr:hypothetical protein [Deltaproteobacteria bacterium]
MTKSKPCFLALDQGGHSSRAILFDERGRLLAQSKRRVGTSISDEGWIEQDPMELVSSLREVVATVDGRRSGLPAHRIAKAGMATQRSSIVCWDRQTGEPLTPVISWQDVRAAQGLEGLSDKFSEIHRRTGLFPNAHFGATKLRWCLDEVPAVQRAFAEDRLAFGPLASFLLYHLLDERPLLVDAGNAARTLLCNIETGDWDLELLSWFELPAQALPRCVPTRFDYGHLSVGNERVPFCIANGDQAAALFAHGALARDTLIANVGTGAFLSLPVGSVPIACSRLLSSLVCQDEEKRQFAVEGTVNAALGAIEWVVEALVEEGTLTSESTTKEGLRALLEKVACWLEEETQPPLFLNGVSGLGAPFWQADFPSQFVGDGSVAAKLVAAVESIAFLLQANLDEMRRGVSAAPRQIRMTGGLASLDGLCQRLADLSGLLVTRPEMIEATAQGTAFLLAGQPSSWKLDPGTARCFEPKENPALNQRYARWSHEMEQVIQSLG